MQNYAIDVFLDKEDERPLVNEDNVLFDDMLDYTSDEGHSDSAGEEYSPVASPSGFIEQVAANVTVTSSRQQDDQCVPEENNNLTDQMSAEDPKQCCDNSVSVYEEKADQNKMDIDENSNSTCSELSCLSDFEPVSSQHQAEECANGPEPIDEREPNPDDVVMTTVTCNSLTVTFLESRTDKGFFRHC